ncbi:MAG: transporter related protein [Nocardioidaceae bacterium]|nr:transporter related protein [Nocardioidaceae bacterium]
MTTATTTGSVLEAQGMSASYGPLRVLYDVDLRLGAGEVVALLGANGAGKTTTLRAISGVLVDVTGDLHFGDGDARTSLVGTTPDRTARLGIAHVPQGRGTFTDLTVEDNLRLGAIARRDRGAVEEDIRSWYETFPRLGERRRQAAGSLSGGEQQMLAVARAMLMRPLLLLLDEPSLGLAPLVVADLFAALRDVRERFGTTMLVVEQNANVALANADRAYVLEAGRIVLAGTSGELLEHDAVQKAYLGQ